MKAAVSIVLQAALWAPSAAAGTATGVVVESAEKGAPADRAGLRSGDVLMRWSAEAARALQLPTGGPLQSPFDLALVEREVVPRTPVVLTGTREGQPLTVRIEAGEWSLKARPVWTGPEEDGYRRGEALAKAGQLAPAIEEWGALADAAGARDDWTLACWLAARIAETVREPAESAQWWAGAQDACTLSGRPKWVALALEARARAWEARLRYADAEPAWREALETWKRVAPGGLGEAAALNGLGDLLRRSRLREAQEPLQAALRLREALAPDSLEVAASLNALGGVALAEGRPDAVDWLGRTLAIRQRLVPDSLLTSRSLSNLAIAERERGDPTRAAELLRQALEIASRLDPEGPAVAAALSNLGNVEADRGDSAAAESYHLKALALAEKRDPKGYVVAANLNALGGLAYRRDESEAAESLYRRSLALFEAISPGSVEVSGTLSALGLTLVRQGRMDEADAAFRRALEMTDRTAPTGRTAAINVSNLINAALRRNDRVSLDALAPRADAVISALPAGSDHAAVLHRNLGDVEAQRGDLAAAVDRYRRSIEILQRYGPFGEQMARSSYGLGVALGGQQRWGEAVAAHRQAIESLEGYSMRMKGAESRVGFGVRHARLYQAAIEALIQAERPEEAFHYWERSRARALLEMMAERDLTLDAELPPELRRQRRALDVAYERAQVALAAASAAEQEQRLERVRQLRREQEDLLQQVLQASPRLASVVYPQPLHVEQARQALDPGTVLLAFAVGDKSTRLFVLEGPGGAEPLAVFTLPVAESELREGVARFRALIAAPTTGEPWAPEGRSLYGLLLGPAEAHLARAQRVLIAPDGPLHLLPFAALRRAAPGRPEQYLVEWKPIHLTTSVTVYSELRKAGGDGSPPAQKSLVAFGDPVYGDLERAASKLDDHRLRRAARRDSGLSPLPGTRTEVQSIARLFPRPTVYLGREATEERAKAIDRRARYVHFASHALLDESSPLDSALALTTPEGSAGENGLLQAWEIIEQLRLDADLVTLSACESAGGREAAGEGLLGLTRAFHHAGARAVLSSLWSVSDDSTAVLMERFYTELRQGRSKDEALRLAQISLLSNPRYAPPGDWAAFALSGDWR